MCQGALTIEGNDFSRNLAYYVIAQASKFVSPGSVRIGSTQTDRVIRCGFQNACRQNGSDRCQ